MLLHFGAVDQIATVWVNNQQVAHHEGGYTEFSADITRRCGGRDRSEMTVLVEDRNEANPFPVGKQRNEPERAVLYRIVRHLADGVDRAGARRAHRQARHHLGPDRYH